MDHINSHQHCGLRSSIFRALGKIVKITAGMTDEPTAREVWKQARNATTSDKAAVAQASALQVGRIQKGDSHGISTNADPRPSSVLKSCCKRPNSLAVTRSLKNFSLQL